ncbi:MAG: CHAT domain-containing protein [Candidatus Eisenbacteria bacterium]
MRRPPSVTLGGLLPALAATCCLSVLAAAPAAAAVDLRARTAALFARHDAATRSDTPDYPGLLADLQATARALDRARLDTLATSAHERSARVLARLARHAEAEREAQLAIAAAARARDPHSLGRSRLTLADLRLTTDPEGTIRLVQDGLPAWRALGDDALLGDAFGTLARAYGDLGRFGDALPATRASLAYFAAAGRGHELALGWSQASQALRFLGRHAEARAVVDSALQYARTHGEEGLVLSRALTEKASLHRTAREFPEALAAIREAIDVDHRRGDRSHERSSRLFRARLYQTMGRNAECAADLDTMLASPDVQRSFSQLTRTAALWARAMSATGRAAEADTALARIISRYERFRAGLADEDDRAGAHEHAAEVYMARTRVLLALKRPEAAWDACERGRGALLEGRLRAAPVPSLDALRARLGATHAALLEFDTPDPTVGNVLLVTADGVRGFALTEFLAMADVNAVLDALGDARASAWPDSGAARLGRALLGAVAPHLPRDLVRLYVVPPSRLELLPFEALTVPGRGVALGELAAVSYVPSAGTLLALAARAEPDRAGAITVLADPVVDGGQRALASLQPAVRGEVLRPLPGARAEAASFARSGARVLLGRDATIAGLRARSSGALLHLATHAIAAPGGGALVLAGRQPLLTAALVESLGIAADLVTLSACGTLGNERRAGEGTLGLVRAFHAAGSRTVVGTRWDVGDAAAARFMAVFYAALRRGAARDAALAEGRATLRAEGFPPRDCWAFLLSGVGDRPVAPLAPAHVRGTSGAFAK